MTPGKVALDVWLGLLALSLICVGLLAVAGALLSALRMANARRRRARMLSRHLTALARWCSVGELAEMNEELEQIWAQGGGPRLGGPVR